MVWTQLSNLTDLQSECWASPLATKASRPRSTTGLSSWLCFLYAKGLPQTISNILVIYGGDVILWSSHTQLLQSASDQDERWFGDWIFSINDRK